MGYESEVRYADERGVRWIGARRQDLGALDGLFRALTVLGPIGPGGQAAREELWRVTLPPGFAWGPRLGRTAVMIEAPAATGSRRIVLKLVSGVDGGPIARMSYPFLRSRAARSHEWAHRLRARGVETPRPLGYLERARSPRRHLSFALFEHVPAPTLIEVLGNEAPPTPDRKRRAIAEVARAVRALHDGGVYHADLHSANLLLAEETAMVIDLEAVRSVRWPGRGVVQNLARLNRDFLDTKRISRADRMRFLRAYLARAADAKVQARWLWRRVGELTMEKLAERGLAFY